MRTNSNVVFKNTCNKDVFKSNSCSKLRIVVFKGYECNMHLVMHVEECFKTHIIKIVMSAVWMLPSFKSVISGNGAIAILKCI